jgi:cytoskeletal protein RodZ
MTTHEEQTMTDSPEESPIPVSETPRVQDESTAVTAEQTPSVETPAPSTETAEVDPPSAEHEPSAEEGLFAGDGLADLRARWAGVQAAFVDDPKDCVQKADALVSDLVEQLATGFAQARSRLEEQWSRGKEASTEDLRLALMHYREFFERLLAV